MKPKVQKYKNFVKKYIYVYIMYIHRRANRIYIYRWADGRYIYIHIYPKKSQFAAKGQFVLVLKKRFSRVADPGIISDTDLALGKA